MNLMCPTNGKDFIMPTKHWLQSIKELISSDVSSVRSKIILSNMITDKILKNEILVKMTSCRQHQIKEFTSKMKGLPNIVSTYCVLLCHDDFLMINESKQYCNLENIDKKLKTKEEYIRMLEKAKNYNYSVTLELMEYYRNGSIVSIDKINLMEFCSILLQLVFCQLNLFSFFRIYT